MIYLSCVYPVRLRGYDTWAKYFMNFVIFKHTYSAFHPDSGTYLCGYKRHHMQYFICVFNYKVKRIFLLGSMVIFMREEFP